MKLHQTFRLEETIIKAATKFAESENRTISNVYETAVIEYLKARGQKIKKPSTK
jgi:hypothetical protein